MRFSEFEERVIRDGRCIRLQTESAPLAAKPALNATVSSPQQEAWDSLVEVVNKHFDKPDVDAIRGVYSAVAAHGLSGQLVWPMVVAPPGSMKTELLKALDGLPNVHSIDSVTPKTFISGQIHDPLKGDKQRPSSLLQRIGADGIVLCLDFSTVLAMKSDDRNSVMADMRRIYDGELKKEFGTSDAVPAWRGRITFAVAVTNEIERHYSVIQSLGARFLTVRMQRADAEAAIKAMAQDPAKVASEMRLAVHRLFSSLSAVEPAVADPLRRMLASLAEFTARGRSHVPRDSRTKAIIGDPQPESATRLAQQFVQLVKGSARLSGRDAAEIRDYAVAVRAAFDSLPQRRRVILEGCFSGQAAPRRTSTAVYDSEDLRVLGLLDDSGRLSKLGLQCVRAFDTDGTFTGYHPSAVRDKSEGDPTGVGGTFSEGNGEGGGQ